MKEVGNLGDVKMLWNMRFKLHAMVATRTFIVSSHCLFHGHLSFSSGVRNQLTVYKSA